MKSHLRLCTNSNNQPAEAPPRDSYPFPSEAASHLTRSAPNFARLNPLPFPLPFPHSHPENSAPRRGASGSKVRVPVGDVLMTDDLIRNVFGAIDKLQGGINAACDELDSYQFPVEEDRPFAA